MANMDVDSSVAGGTETDQARYGTHDTHYAKLVDRFRELEEGGAADGARFKTVCFQLLKSFEALRVSREGQIKKLSRQIEYNRAQQEMCSMFSKILVGMIATQVQEAQSGTAPTPVPNKAPDAPISDKEMLQRICVCGCQDEEDAKDCDCTCHTVGYCDNENCVVCSAEKLRRASETGSRRKAPVTKKKVAKKKAKKKVTKKKATKKKATKKVGSKR